MVFIFRSKRNVLFLRGNFIILNPPTTSMGKKKPSYFPFSLELDCISAMVKKF